MLDYMRALHQRFFQEPECQDLQEQAEKLRQELKERLDRNGREKLLKLADLNNELQETISLESFLSGFKLALGIAAELAPSYSIDNEEEQRACEALRQRRDE